MKFFEMFDANNDSVLDSEELGAVFDAIDLDASGKNGYKESWLWGNNLFVPDLCGKMQNINLDKFNYVNKMAGDLAKSSPFDFKKLAGEMGQKGGDIMDFFKKDYSVGKNDEEESGIMTMVNMQKDDQESDEEGIMQMVNMQKTG